MAQYGSYYTFSCISLNGNRYEIDIKKKGYSGTPKDGVLGGSPRLRRDKNERICGASLEFPVECQVDGELAEFYTSDASMYRVELKSNGAIIFIGYLLPELYSEPDIAPPYDVIFTAVDGLGELKRVDFAGNCADSLHTILTSILSHTGSELELYYIHNLRCLDLQYWSENDNAIFKYMSLDIRHLDGGSCYDALQRILETFNAVIFQAGDRWLITMENALDAGSLEVCATNAEETKEFYYNVPITGPVGVADYWPIGHLSSAIQPAKKKVLIKAVDEYRDGIFEDSKFKRQSSPWYTEGTVGTSMYKGAYCKTLNNFSSAIYQTTELQDPTRRDLELVVRALNCNHYNYEYSCQAEINLEATATNGKTLYFRHDSYDKSDKATFGDTDVPINKIGVYIPSEYEKTPVEVKLTIPLSETPDGYLFKSFRIHVRCSAGSANQVYPIIVECSLSSPKNTRAKGFKIEAVVNNGAREDASEISSLIPADDDSYRIWGYESIYGIPFYNRNNFSYNERYLSWKERKNTLLAFATLSNAASRPFIKVLTESYARSFGLPRLRLQGCLNVPDKSGSVDPAEQCIPVVVQNAKGMNFMPETVDWALCDDEMDVDMLSVPAADVTITRESRTLIDDE